MYGIYLELLDIYYPCCGLLERMTNVYAKKGDHLVRSSFSLVLVFSSAFNFLVFFGLMHAVPSQEVDACTITHETLMFIILS